ncbi:sensor histidine kinase [Streptomyces acidiscabies]|uniref:histidine kinase n=1 Tax=Streptomyces acidiscabies TaxID=42234 RepID=A0AAP6BDJ8_9ACTN|nr:histidine kinase [Streptomyces acidiscabies]MBP5934647.1 sensor histidine kinase [Streptomyces sp. LBUM 1476]MBZ3917633.1 sensor histidine kinase [Streptomyces acidiscabies]MDX2962680.1 histidine kinase [Streptomyces acidiscabies]MDX3019013.1 histidine kinase [Streptomyces acidiscabies]MDX3790315.1 histidine kinase [Streptomyces acidiscabies]
MHLTARLRPFVPASAAFHVMGLLIHLGVLLTLGLPWIFFDPSALWAVLLAVAVPVTAVVYAGPVLTKAQRTRLRTRLGVEIPEGRAGRGELTYHLLAGPLLTLGATLVLLAWGAAGVAAAFYVWIWAVPPDWRLANAGYTVQGAYITAAGLALLYGAAWSSGALARLDGRIASVRLGPGREAQLAYRVSALAESRAGLVDAVDAERRRIERDLHDGAQQRLVSLAVNLGIAKATLTELPPDARRVLAEAHREAKEAIEELGALVRGLHPAVLEDRGLDAALSGLAGRAPIPVRVRVELSSRPSATAESVAYFVVSEALTNVVKHAEASRAEVSVERFGPTLLVVVSDDGVGGARVGAGSGLAGLVKRVAAVDGKLSLDSPVGGPTVLTVELPCVP